MSQQLINRSPDLKRLQDEGFEVSVSGSHLSVSGIPYVNSKSEICTGILVTELEMAGDKTKSPQNHVIHFIGEQPCHKNGSVIEQIRNQETRKAITSEITIERSFSNKPRSGYSDYYHKVTTYINIISSPANSLDPSVTAKTFKVIESEGENDIFHYLDTNSSRAEINIISDKLKGQVIGIIGLGGTGSYVLDFVSKTPVKEIHLYDGDDFLQHNAFRAPGAPSKKQLEKKHKKVEYLSAIYSKMRKGIYAHKDFINTENMNTLPQFDYVFVCIDNGEVKKELFRHFIANDITFIDVGMGIEVADDKLIGIIRTTASTAENREYANNKISFSDGEDDEYSTNIQIAELNALNASMAVMKWKKLSGFYQDFENEYDSTYTLNVHMLTSEVGNEA